MLIAGPIMVRISAGPGRARLHPMSFTPCTLIVALHVLVSNGFKHGEATTGAL